MWRLGLAALALTGCSQIFGLEVPTVTGSGGSDDASNTASIGGTVSGLGTASGLVLQNNGGDDDPIRSDGAFQFPTTVAIGTGYDVTVSVQPTNPSEKCDVAGGKGVAKSDVTDIAVTCGAASYTIGGNVVGLSGSVTLHNGADTFAASTDGAFTFSVKVLSGQPYNVSATGNTACAVFGGTGTVGNADVTSVVVNCGSGSGPYTIGGMMSGLNGNVVLRNNANSDTVAVSSNGTYAFPTPVPSGGNYNVTVQTQPAYPPAKQNCVVANASGNAGGNVQNINVTCTTASYTVGGGINGLSGTVVLQDNGTDDLTRTMNGGYTFATPLLSGTPYNVTVSMQPVGQVCTLSGATGTVANNNVNGVNANCQPEDKGITCGTTSCSGTQGCCDPEGGKTCRSKANCLGLFLPCDDEADCGVAEHCCASPNGGGTAVSSVTCATICNGASKILCNPGSPGDCNNGLTCQPYGLLPGYYACQ